MIDNHESESEHELIVCFKPLVKMIVFKILNLGHRPGGCHFGCDMILQ